MGSWLLRGVCMALLLAGIDVGLAALAAREATPPDLLRPISLGLVVGVAAVWGALDTWRRVDRRGRNWLCAALLAGLLSGVLRVVGRALFVDETGLSALGPALTGDAAFAALVVLVPAAIGVLVGGGIRPRGSAGNAAETDQEDPVGQRDAAKSGPRA